MEGKTLLMCSPKYFGVTHEINYDSHLKEQADPQLVASQWKILKSTLKSLGCRVEVVKGQKGWADMVYTANAGLVIGDKKIIISLFKYAERQGESKYFKEWFDQHGWETHQPEAIFEGAGEAFFWKNNLLLGVGYRSNFYTKYALQEYIPGIKIIDLTLIDKYFYHLDLALTPIPSKNLIAYCPEAFNDASLRKIRFLDADLLEVDYEDARKPAYGCNAIPVGESIIVNKGTRKLADEYSRKGLSVIELDLSEFHKMGGSARCLTLDLH